MKKIKYLLIFWLFTLFWIGSSFWIFIELNDSTWSQLLIPNYWFSSNQSNFNFQRWSFSYLSWNCWSLLNNAACFYILACSTSDWYFYKWFYGYRNIYSFWDMSNCSNDWPSVFEYLYMSSPTSISPYSLRSTWNITAYIYFDDTKIYTNYWSIQDVPTWYIRKKLFLNSAWDYWIVSSWVDNSDLIFTSIGADSFDVDDLWNWLYDFDLDIYSWVLLLHNNSYIYDYYVWTNTLFLFLWENSINYNIYTWIYNWFKEIQDLWVFPIDKWVLTINSSSSDWYSEFMNFLNSDDKIVLTSFLLNQSITFTSYWYYFYSQTNLWWWNFTKTTSLSLNFQSDDNIPTFISPSWWWWSQSNENPFWIFWTKSLFYYCNVQMSTYDSLFCYNPDWSRKSDEELKNCFVSKYANLESWTGSSEFYCIDDRWLIENIDIQIEWSWSVFVPCESDLCQFSSDFWSLWMSWYSVDFFENYLNTTWYFFKCPRPYDSKLTIRPKLITLLNWVDILLPINCWIAWFSYWKNILTFENSWHFVPNWPLLNFEWEDRTLLYYFFDILISIWIVVFVWKIFYLFHK